MSASRRNNNNRANNRGRVNLASNSGEQPNLRRDPRIGLQKVKDLLANEAPEDILLKMQNPHFGLDLYLHAESLGDDLIQAFAELLVKALSCNSMREQTSKLILKLVDARCTFLTKHLYSYVMKKTSNGLDQFNVDVIRSSLSICAAIHDMNPGNFVSMEPLKDRLENIVKLKMNNQELIDKFNDLDVSMSRRRLDASARSQASANNRSSHTFRANNMVSGVTSCKKMFKKPISIRPKIGFLNASLIS